MKRMQGKIIAISGKDTVKVSVERKWQHPLYLKRVKRNKNYLCHCQMDNYSLGDEVIIESVRPISKTKHFKVVAKVSL